MAPSTETEVSAHFQSLATNYERMTGGTTRTIARHIVSVSPAIDETAVILDNAAGSGIVIDEIYAAIPPSIHPTIYAADAAPAMLDLLEYNAKQRGWQNVTATVAPGEALDYSDDTFTHSFTNFGIFFFKDPSLGAKNIFRTLKPGGTALVTTWHDLGYLEPFRRVEARIRPSAPAKEFPISLDWMSGEHAKGVLVQAGFEGEKVTTYEQTSHMQAENLETLLGNLKLGLNPFMEGWSEEEKGRYQEEMIKEVSAVPGLIDVVDGKTRLKMIANIIIAVK